MAFSDLREWIEQLEAAGELRRIKARVDWNEEIGAIVRRVFDLKERGPALLFEHIKDYEQGRCRRLFTASMGNYARIAMMLGLPRETPVREIILTVRSRVQTPVPPVVVPRGPIKENVLRGSDVRILDFPVPKWHPKDGGRYVNTFCGIVTRDPEEGWLNVGLYRGMVVGQRTISNALLAGKHWGIIYHKYRVRGEPMPVAVFYGCDPVLPFAACAPHQIRAGEYEIAGGLRGAPVELVRCETSDLLVPAAAEIVFEGVVPPDPESYREEGPFGEVTGYYAGISTRRPVIEVQCITHRNDPIYQGTLEGGPINEDHRCSSISMSALAWEALERNGIPGVRDVFCPPVGFATSIRVQINKRYQGHARQVAACLWGLNALTNYKLVTVVDDDVDIHDPDAMEWALCYHVDPREDIVVFPGCPGSPLDPSTDPEYQDPVKYGGGLWNRCLIDATRTWRWGPRPEWDGKRFPPLIELRPEVARLVRERWAEYGLPGPGA
ncbi:MAG: UbiD family decarboxylase [Deltaproteobacteria bacterium]|nr:UbiD family decarboxylase [Deltaproteobacteria bacterium]